MSVKQLVRIGIGTVVLVLLLAMGVWRGDILRARLDPQVPFQTYEPPQAPDYTLASSWALRDATSDRMGNAAVFFLHSTTFDGGKHWNGPIGSPAADAYLERVVLPNFAGPFAMAGEVSAPLYRQGSLYTRMTLREDAREARGFAYRDALNAFRNWLANHPEGPIVIAGVEQGAELVGRLLNEEVSTSPELRQRLVAAYMMDAVVPVSGTGLPLCENRQQTGCVMAWSMVEENKDGAVWRRVRRALYWDERGRLKEVGVSPVACTNPVSGSNNGEMTTAREHLGAANATGLEWGLRPAFIDRQVQAQCRDGFLRHTKLKTESFRENRNWTDRRKATPYNLFYADTEADVLSRLDAWNSHQTTDLMQ